ncbi:DNA primase small subunit domain-containing protein [Ditylenchus destructor]|nr:DNA primase small subunit domain-containing protein [Ditylenchus destructor]
MELDKNNADHYLKDYYRSLYPVDRITKWLSYGKDSSEYFARREFAFILEDDIHVRYLSFNNLAEFIEKLQRNKPYKIDIGAIYSRPPCDRKKVGEFVAKERELVFDIDLTDYDSIRTCCSGTAVCHKCWRFIVITVKVLEHLLRGHFGFQHLLWVFSGRRGIHCWVADENARQLTNRGREAIAKYLTFDKTSSVITKSRVHPMAEHSYRTIMDCCDIDKLILEQKWLDSEENWDPILKLCEDPQMRNTLHSEFLELESAEYRWNMLKVRFDEKERQKTGQDLPSEPSEAAKNFLKIFVLSYTYPKLDQNVTTGVNHLLKCPFSVHPKNGNIAVPLNAKIIDRFQLDQVPRVDKLLQEMSKINQEESAENKENRRKQYYEHTSLAPYIEIFDSFVENLY